MILTTTQLEARYTVSRRTVANWIKSGCPHTSDSAGNTFAADEVDEWIATSVRGGGKYLARVAPAPEPPPPPRKLQAPKRPAGLPDDIPVDATAAELVDMMSRLQTAERTAHDSWRAALRDLTKSVKQNTKPAISPSAIEQLRNSWNALVEARRKWEKDLPTILADKGRFVDTQLVSEQLTMAGTATATALEGIGVKVSGAIAAAIAADPDGQIPERAIRDLVDHAVRDAQRHLAQTLEKLAAK